MSPIDVVGNRLSKTDSVEGTTTYTYDDNDRLTLEVGSSTTTQYTYDNNGNVVKEEQLGGPTLNYIWDSQDRLTAIEVIDGTDTTTIEYQYNLDGVRVSSTVNGEETRYLIDANRTYAEVVEEYTPGQNSDVSYVHGIEVISQTQGGESDIYLYDGHSGVRQLTDETGQVTDTYTFDAYGNVFNFTGTTENNYLYRGEQDDPNVDFQYLRARYYDTDTGRFISTDPFEGWQEVPISRHRYVYGNDNPVMYTDPSGLFSLTRLTVARVLASDLQGVAAAIGGATFLAQGYLANNAPSEIIWDGNLTFYNNSNFFPEELAGILPVMLSAGIGFLRASTINALNPYDGKWGLVSAGVSGGITNVLPPIVNASTTITSPAFAGSNFLTLSGEFLFFGAAASGGALGGFTVGFGRGTYFTSGYNPGASNGIGTYAGLSLPLGPFGFGRLPRFPNPPSTT